MQDAPPYFPKRGFCHVPMLEFLNGRKWDDYAMAIVHSLRPSALRTSITGALKCDAVMWRVTVLLNEDGTIKEIWQEAEVGLPDPWNFGSDADHWIQSGNNHDK
jgi:hypothetical protein